MAILNEKQQEILFELVRSFIRSGMPVGSETLAECMPGEHKPSTLRYTLGKLEEFGFLRKAHASSGRLPTDKAYRAYVDALIDRTYISRDEETNIRQALEQVHQGLSVLIRRTCEVVAEHSELMSVVVTPEPNFAVINIVRLVPLDANTILAVIVTGDENAHTRVVHLPIELNAIDLNTLERHLNAALAGKRLFDITEELLADIFNRAHVNQFFMLNLRRPLVEFLREMRFMEGGRLQVKGHEHIASVLEHDPGQLRGVLGLLEDEHQLVSLLTTIEGGLGVRALIGSDFSLEGMDRFAMIFTDFVTQGDSRGKVGVLGPSRMDYGRIIPLVKLIGEILDDKIRRQPLVIE